MGTSAEETTQKALAELRLSIDGTHQPLKNGHQTNGINGMASPGSSSTRSSTELNGQDKTAKLQKELDQCRQEKDALATQYQNLVSRLNTMRTTLGTKLKQDGEELDRREQLIAQLNAQNEELTVAIETLHNEILTSNAEAERASKELEMMRNRQYEDNSQESLIRERELRELQAELERCRMERDEWEREAMEGRITIDENRTSTEMLKRDLELEVKQREEAEAELRSEREKASNLQSVLEDFQLSKEHELRQAVQEREARYNEVTQALAEYKHRALSAELKLEETSHDSTRTTELEKEVKEKNLLIGKLRHEAVILNEHLTEALRRLRRNQSDNNVDRRLVTNVLLSFLTTPRADAKRFEMLNLLSSILSWGDLEREKAGLQRVGTSSARSGSTALGKAPTDIELNDETESFSQRWVEFLLKESSPSLDAQHSPTSAAPTPSRSNISLPSPSLSEFPKTGPSSPRSPNARTLRLSSFTSSRLSSSPNLSSTQNKLS